MELDFAPSPATTKKQFLFEKNTMDLQMQIEFIK